MIKFLKNRYKNSNNKFELILKTKKSLLINFLFLVLYDIIVSPIAFFTYGFVSEYVSNFVLFLFNSVIIHNVLLFLFTMIAVLITVQVVFCLTNESTYAVCKKYLVSEVKEIESNKVEE